MERKKGERMEGESNGEGRIKEWESDVYKRSQEKHVLYHKHKIKQSV